MSEAHKGVEDASRSAGQSIRANHPELQAFAQKVLAARDAAREKLAGASGVPRTEQGVMKFPGQQSFQEQLDKRFFEPQRAKLLRQPGPITIELDEEVQPTNELTARKAISGLGGKPIPQAEKPKLHDYIQKVQDTTKPVATAVYRAAEKTSPLFPLAQKYVQAEKAYKDQQVQKAGEEQEMANRQAMMDIIKYHQAQAQIAETKKRLQSGN